MSHVTDFSLQADETLCTILYTIGDQKVDVGKAMIMEPKESLFHSRPIPPNVFKVSVVSVKSGHENLAPPGGDPAAAWWLQWVGPVVAKESASSGGGREHTHDHVAASARYEHQHPTYPISVACHAG